MTIVDLDIILENVERVAKTLECPEDTQELAEMWLEQGLLDHISALKLFQNEDIKLPNEKVQEQMGEELWEGHYLKFEKLVRISGHEPEAKTLEKVGRGLSKYAALGEDGTLNVSFVPPRRRHRSSDFFSTSMVCSPSRGRVSYDSASDISGSRNRFLERLSVILKQETYGEYLKKSGMEIKMPNDLETLIWNVKANLEEIEENSDAPEKIKALAMKYLKEGQYDHVLVMQYLKKTKFDFPKEFIELCFERDIENNWEPRIRKLRKITSYEPPENVAKKNSGKEKNFRDFVREFSRRKRFDELACDKMSEQELQEECMKYFHTSCYDKILALMQVYGITPNLPVSEVEKKYRRNIMRGKFELFKKLEAITDIKVDDPKLIKVLEENAENLEKITVPYSVASADQLNS
ncbi:hypothetical protein KY308_02960 [Candidatus Woesearchaeota archaeon]|nr:hypothetical protein [Candidatus Woesearchaeota archaeon]